MDDNPSFGNVFMAALEMGKHCDSVEAGYGERFEATVTKTDD